MTTAIIPARRRLDGITSRAWEHPTDRGALALLGALPGVDDSIRKLSGWFGERGVRLAFQADALLVDETQFPQMYRVWQRVHDTLDVQERYDLYVTQSPFAATGALGLAEPFVVLHSGALRLLSESELEFLLGHELGHILSGHALYHTVLVLLSAIGGTALPISGIALAPVLAALREWQRKSVVSADRAGLLAVQNPDAAMRALMRLAGGGTDAETDLAAFLRQGQRYRESDEVIDQVWKVLITIGRPSPALVVRAAQLRDWIEDGSYDRVLRGEYVRRTDPTPPWREEAGAIFSAEGVDAEGVATAMGRAARKMRDAVEGSATAGAAGKMGDAARRMRDAFDRGYTAPESPPEESAPDTVNGDTAPSPSTEDTSQPATAEGEGGSTPDGDAMVPPIITEE